MRYGSSPARNADQLTAAAQTDDLTTWARGDGLEIVLVVLGAILACRAVAAVGHYATRRIDAAGGELDDVVRTERGKHQHALVQVLIWLGNVTIVCIAIVRCLTLLGFSLTGFVAPAAVLGVALGFGAQRIVQDLLAGFFIIAERQYGFGDLVRISTLGSETGVTGTIEEVSLRITKMRTFTGELVIVPNGQLVQVTNLSRDWARAVIDIPLWPNSDLVEAQRILREVGADVYRDPKLRPLLLDEPTVMGVETISTSFVKVRMVARTLPDRQYEVGRALRARVITAFREQGISLPTDTIIASSAPGTP
ncbi:mechanosensitive ion channel family protein [Sporichthya polymorpha]|uniref:mechanosensitive ion channel family protein n=1 Tax=Sporichthya polymorpha TaxID=35751 RepID=UPI000377470E|nr:mechanosensitive ion channel family protein [Sporichthya polymorpha]